MRLEKIVIGDEMSRKPRIHYEGALYHVMVRGNNGEKVFINRKRKTSIHKHNKRIQGKISVLNLCILHNG